MCHQTRIISSFLVITVATSYDVAKTVSGKIGPSENQQLRETCGQHFLPETETMRRKRSIGGKRVREKEYPWVVALLGPSTTCSAVLITSRHALTAAHCVAERRRGITCALPPEGDLQKMYMRLPHDQMHVVPGTRAVYSTKIDESFTTYYVKNVIIHSGYNVCNGKNDLALLEFSPKMDAEGSPICMPKEDEDLPLKQERLTAAGFGYDPDHPGEFYLEAVKLSFDYAPRDLTRIVTGTRGKSICYGDSGGPLFKRKSTSKWILLGIAIGYNDCDKNTVDEMKGSFFEDMRFSVRWVCENSGVCPRKKPSQLSA